METVILKVRDCVEDWLITTGIDEFDYETSTSSKIFTLSNSNAVSSSIVVYKNGVLWADSNYSYDSDTGKITVTGTLSAGDTLEVNYSYYEKYSDGEIRGYIRSSFTHLAIEKYRTYTAKSDNVIFPTPTEQEEYLIALIASILIQGSIRTYRTPEITITFNETDSKETKIKKIIKQFRKTYGVLEYIDTTSVSEIEEEI